MILKTLSILNYRNIQEADLSFSPKLNCFVGSNGVGKTNLLDAIYYLSFCRSAFSQTNQQVLRHGEEWMVLQGMYEQDHDEPIHIHCGLKMGHRKSFKKNGKEYPKLSAHIGLLPLVMVTPHDSELILGGGDVRRQFMDMVISQYAPQYLQNLIHYNQVLKQRNALLKLEGEPDEALISSYDEQLAIAGNEIYRYRKSFIADFVPIFKDVYERLGGEDESVDLAYRSHMHEGDLLQMLASHRLKDHIMGYTLKGVHRDDMEMLLGGYPLKYEGSQGQSKTYLISLKFAQFLYLSRIMKHRVPLMLLDDIFDKLDAHRVEKIVRMVAGEDYGQIFITSTNRTTLEDVVAATGKDYRFFQVNNGSYEIC